MPVEAVKIKSRKLYLSHPYSTASGGVSPHRCDGPRRPTGKEKQNGSVVSHLKPLAELGFRCTGEGAPVGSGIFKDLP